MLWADMLKGVLSKVRGCPEIEAIEQMRHTVREWCERTQCLVQPAQVVTSDVALPIDMTDVYVIDLVDAEVAGEPIDVLPMNDRRIRDATDRCPVLVFADQNTVQMVPEPASPVTVDLLLVLSVGPDATEAPDVLWQRYREQLTHGALYRLLAQDGDTWANPAKATWHAGQWNAAITRQAALSGKNRITKAQRLRSQPV